MKKIKEVMTRTVQCVPPTTGLREVAKKMQELDVGSIPICENDRLVGMVTDRDIVLKTLGGSLDPKTARAKDVMTSPIVFCYEDQDVNEASRLMEVKRIRRLAVLSRDKRLVGIVSLGDLSLHGESDILAAETLRRISKSSRHPVYV